MRVRGVDMHAQGALLVANRPLPPRSVVFVRLNSYRLMGFAQVRHCTGLGLWSYAIGVTFRAPLMREEVGSWQVHQVHQADGGDGRPATISVTIRVP